MKKLEEFINHISREERPDANWSNLIHSSGAISELLKILARISRVQMVHGFMRTYIVLREICEMQLIGTVVQASPLKLTKVWMMNGRKFVIQSLLRANRDTSCSSQI